MKEIFFFFSHVARFYDLSHFSFISTGYTDRVFKILPQLMEDDDDADADADEENDEWDDNEHHAGDDNTNDVGYGDLITHWGEVELKSIICLAFQW